jgi:hypothetical protein
MPDINGKKFPYTAKGKKDAKKYAEKTKPAVAGKRPSAAKRPAVAGQRPSAAKRPAVAKKTPAKKAAPAKSRRQKQSETQGASGYNPSLRYGVTVNGKNNEEHYYYMQPNSNAKGYKPSKGATTFDHKGNKRPEHPMFRRDEPRGNKDPKRKDLYGRMIARNKSAKKKK